MERVPYDQRVARRLVGPLADIGVTPNQVTWLTLVLAMTAAVLFARGEPVAAAWGAGLFVLARFLDHFDGELARLTGNTSRFGYLFDYIAGALSYAALFLGIGIGLAEGTLGSWALLLGAGGAVSAIGSLFLNMELDRLSDLGDGESIGYPGLAGFELEDGIYLLAPITWAGFLTPFFVAAGLGAICYGLWSAFRVLRSRSGGGRIEAS